MALKYPGPKRPINHPIPKKEPPKKLINKSNMGQTLEDDVSVTNDYYLETKRAVVYKKPTPIQIVHVNYPSRNKAKITEAYYKIPSTTDFNGIYKGFYIDFDCKETQSKTSIPLSNIHPHQIEHLRRITAAGGIGFLIVYFAYYNEHYYLPFEVLYKYYMASLEEGRKSIPYQVFKDEAYRIPFSYNPRVDYLSVIDEHILPTFKIKGHE